MKVYTNNPEFSREYFELNNSITECKIQDDLWTNEFIKSSNISSYIVPDNFWEYSLVTEYSESSQFDTLIRLINKKSYLPDKLVCLAGYGKKFHGFRNRPWESTLGNIHLSCYFRPQMESQMVGLGFTILAAVSVIDTLDSIDFLNGIAMIKWVNDIVVDNKKICGVIAQNQVQGQKVTDAVVGIGLNVEKSPVISPTSFVPGATCINDLTVRKYKAGEINQILLSNLAKNYVLLINQGFKPLLEKYKSRSLILNNHVEIWSDPQDSDPLLEHEGIVCDIGDYLELYLAGIKSPITSGRLVYNKKVK